MRFFRRSTTPDPADAPPRDETPRSVAGASATLFERFLESPEGRRLRAEQLAQDIEARRARAADIDATKAKLAAVAARENAIVEANKLDEERAHEAARAATRRRLGAELTRAESTLPLETRLTRLEAEQRADAPAAIEHFIGDARSLLEDLQTRGWGAIEAGSARNGYYATSVSNRAAIEARLTALRQAIAGAEDLKLQALDQVELEERLAALRADVDRVVAETPLLAEAVGR